MENLKDEITAKSEQIDLLEKQISNSFIASDKTEQSGALQVCSIGITFALFYLFLVKPNTLFVQQTVADLMAQLNEKSFELEVTVIYTLLIFAKSILLVLK